MITFFDTETTGLPLDWKAPMSQVDNWPRVIQLAWLVCDERGAELHNGKFLIKPDGWKIPQEEFWIKNGFTTEANERDGIPVADALRAFIAHLRGGLYLVSHNMDFDHKVLGAEMIRAKVFSETKPLRICTKEASTQFCKIPFAGRKQYPGARAQNYKWPKLTELHEKLFGVAFQDAHDAMGDVVALKNCFFELVRLGVIVLPKPEPAQ